MNKEYPLTILVYHSFIRSALKLFSEEFIYVSIFVKGTVSLREKEECHQKAWAFQSVIRQHRFTCAFPQVEEVSRKRKVFHSSGRLKPQSCPCKICIVTVESHPGKEGKLILCGSFEDPQKKSQVAG